MYMLALKLKVKAQCFFLTMEITEYKNTVCCFCKAEVSVKVLFLMYCSRNHLSVLLHKQEAVLLNFLECRTFTRF